MSAPLVTAKRPRAGAAGKGSPKGVPDRVTGLEPAARGRPARSRIERAIFLAFCLVVVLAPLWLGSNSPLFWGINAALVGLLLIVYELALLIAAEPHPVNLRRIALEITAFAVVVAWIGVQMSGSTPADWHHPIWALTAEAIGESVAGTVTVNADLTFLALLRLLTAAAVFWLALQFGRDPDLAHRMLRWIAVAGFFYAFYGVVSFVLFPDTLLIFEKTFYQDSLTSTFVNRNSYATYAGLTLVAMLGMLLRDLGLGREGGNLRVAAARLIEAAGSRSGLYLVAAFVIVAALALTASRAGITSSLLGAAVLLTFFGLRAQRRRRIALPIFVVLLIAVTGAIYGFGGTFFERLGSTELESSDRLAAYALTWRSILDSPLVGFGYGTFQEVFPMYRDTTVGPWGAWDRAHNTYLEVLQGLGLPAGALLVGVALALVGRCAVAAIRRNRNAAAPLVATAASFIVGLHAFVDFSLQIQAITLTWSALLGLGVAQSWSSGFTLASERRER